MDSNDNGAKGIQFNEPAGIQFNLKVNNPSIIKVVGVGGGGGNAVTHMYNEGIHDVTYVLCNTDSKALSDSPVPTKLQMGEGLGAGNRPEVGRKAAQDSIDQIKQLFADGTRMAFITAGMGGGTGTGAAPIVAQCAREMDILTVGIVTIPFRFEGHKKIDQALDGVEEMSKHVDALLVINNERLREIYPDLTVLNGFAKADDTLSIAAKSIAEIITMRGLINLDFQDVTTVLKDGGVAIMSTGYGEGENRVTKAFNEALHSPLLNKNDVFNSKKVLFYINFSRGNDSDQLTMEEMNEVTEFMSKFDQDTVEVKWGLGTDDSLGTKVKITLLASGFGLQNVPLMESAHGGRVMREPDEDRLRREEEEEEKANRRSTYYNEDDKKPTKPRRYVYIFTDDVLDNDDLISMVESTPTVDRNKNELKQIQEKAASEQTATETVDNEADNSQTFTIQF
ncbi:MAG: cell division protein FtsZ [Bacteroidaceae bacterium]|nr:cell division protein FtsZ [Bacteroidaceae bacterium]